MAHAQHFLGYNAWVPTVRESVNKTNPQPTTGMPRIATTLGLDDHMKSFTSAILQTPTATASATAAVRESKSGTLPLSLPLSEGIPSSSSNECLADSATYPGEQKYRAPHGGLYTNSLYVHVHSAALVSGDLEAVSMPSSATASSL
jgi:hypothetical protein